jgi:hypothetical protein
VEDVKHRKKEFNMNKKLIGSLVMSLLLLLGAMIMTGCDNGTTDDDFWVEEKLTLTLTFPNPEWPNMTIKDAGPNEWGKFSTEIYIPLENVTVVDYESLVLYWTNDTKQYEEKLSIGLTGYTNQKLKILYTDAAYAYTYEGRNKDAVPLGTHENPVEYELEIGFKVKY